MSEPVELSSLRPGRTLNTAFAVIGSVVFLGGALVTAYKAWSAQAAGLLMPNGQGKFMPPSRGFEIAAAMAVVSLFYVWRSWVLLRRKP
jgi:hypothetical protein